MVSTTNLKNHEDKTAHFATLKDVDKDKLKDQTGNPDLENDHAGKHSCTDIICVLVFLAFLGFMCYLTGYAKQNGNVARLTHGFDYSGNLCGVDEAVKDKPKLYYCPSGGELNGIPTSINTKAPVCIASCPLGNETAMITCASPTTAQNSTIVTATGEVSQIVNMISESKPTKMYATTEILGLYCLPDLNKIAALAQSVGVEVPVGLRSSVTDSHGPINGVGQKFVRDIGGLKRCSMLLGGACVLAMALSFLYLFILRMCAKPLVYISMLLIILLFASISGFFLLGEYTTSRPPPIQAVVSASTTAAAVTASTTAAGSTLLSRRLSGLSMGYTPVEDHLEIEMQRLKDLYGSKIDLALLYGVRGRQLLGESTTIAPSTIITNVPTAFPTTTLGFVADAQAKFAAATEALQHRWDEYGGRKNYESLNPFYNEHMSVEDAKTCSLVTGIAFGVIGFLVLCIMVCAHNSIDTAVKVVEVAVKCISQVPCMLTMPIVDSVTKIAMFFSCVYVLFLLVSCGTVEPHNITNIQGEDVAGIRRSFHWTDCQLAYIATYLFGIFWLLELSTALGQFVLSYAVVHWYYTPNPKHNFTGTSLIWGYVYGLTFHLGTIAFGSFLIALLRFIRFILAVVSNASKANQSPDAALARCIACIVQCCLKCIQECIEHINKNAYIDVAINNTNFCEAAKHVLQFILQEAAAIAILHGACFIFTVAGVVSIAGSTGYITYLLVTTQERWTAEDSPHHVNSPRLVAIVATVLSAFIAYAFMAIFDHTADTLLYTYSWNKHHGHNTADDYAPEELKNLTEYQPLKQDEKGKEKKEEKKGDCSIQ